MKDLDTKVARSRERNEIYRFAQILEFARPWALKPFIPKELTRSRCDFGKRDRKS